MIRGTWDPHAMECHGVAPERTGDHTFVHRRWWLHPNGWDKFFPWYRIYHYPNGSVNYNLGNVTGYHPDKKYVYDERVRLEDEDLERLFREIQFHTRVRTQTLIIMEMREQLRFNQIVALGKYCDINVRLFGCIGIWTNFWNWDRKFWIIPGMWAALCHFMFIRYYMADASFRYQRLCTTDGVNWAQGIDKSMRSKLWWHSPEPIIQVLGPQYHCKRRIAIHRYLLFISGFMALYKFCLPKMCCVPCKYLPRAPYPCHIDGRALGYWLGYPGDNDMSLEATKFLSKRLPWDYLWDNKAGYIGFALFMWGIVHIFRLPVRR